MKLTVPCGLLCVALFLTITPAACRAQSPDTSAPPPKPFASYFRPIPLHGSLSKDVWGAATVGPRDTTNGLEDATIKQWDYWDGSILKGPDGKYRMFASRWDQATGHRGWSNSKAIEAVSVSLFGPYRDQGLLWPDDLGGKGHNVVALELPDHTYAVVVSETRNGDVYTSRSIDGPWKKLGDITVDQDAFHSLHTPGDKDKQALHAPNPKPWHGSNVDLIARVDGQFEIIQRSGQILISKNGILGPYNIQGDSIYRDLAGMPQDHLDRLEDPVIWRSGGWYHVIVNEWGARCAYHLISRNGIDGWKFEGVAFTPDSDFIRYSDGTVNHWNKIERPGVVLDKGHVVAFTFAVIDVAKEEENGNDGHGSKVIVVPFDGAAMDRDFAKAARTR